jgi:polyhydroxybutyrate depolymerase
LFLNFETWTFADIMTAIRSIGVAIASLVATSSLSYAACFDAPGACKIAGGSYHVAWPPGVPRDKVIPAVVALHSYKASGLGLIKSGKMVKTILARGYAVITPEGTNGSWQFRGGGRDDVAFIRAVADDAAKRSTIARDRMMLAGFSVGGSMVAYVACRSPGAFKAYAPVSGNFWKPEPQSCAGPVNYLHMHGSSDTTMPVAGRAVGKGLRQANLLESLATLARASGCNDPQQKSASTHNWKGCKTSVRLVMHPGGHSVPRFWAGTVLDWFAGL